MLIDFFLHLKERKLPVSVKEYLMLLEGLEKKVIGTSVDEFYVFSRACFVKDERNFDKFDRAFGEYFKGVQQIVGINAEIPLDWLKRQLQREFTAEEKAAIEAMGGLDKLMERMKQLLEDKKSATKVAISGSVQAAHPLLAMVALTPKEFVLAAHRPETEPL